MKSLSYQFDDIYIRSHRMFDVLLCWPEIRSAVFKMFELFAKRFDYIDKDSVSLLK